jgi:RimJ/RimL family protein N-acetyltransferase
MRDIFIEGTFIDLCVPDIERDIVNGNWHNWFNNKETTRYLYHGVFPNTREAQRNFISSEVENPNNLILTIVSKSPESSLLGVVSLKHINLLHGNAEIAIVLGDKRPMAAIEAMALMTAHGFEQLNLNKIYAGQHEELAPWVYVLMTIGYKIEGLKMAEFNKNGKLSAIILTGITRTDYFLLKDKRGGSIFTDPHTLNKIKPKKKLVKELEDFLVRLNDIS